MNKKGYTVAEILIVLGVFSVLYFVIANSVSKNFDVDYENEMYELKIESIEKNAALYGQSKLDLFAEENNVYITVEELAVNGYVLSTDGKVIDPRDENKDLNEVKIKLTKKEENITAKMLV